MKAVQRAPKGHLDNVQSVRFSPDGRLLASCCSDGKTRPWATVTDPLQWTAMAEGVVIELEFSKNGLYQKTQLASPQSQSWLNNHTSNPRRAKMDIIRLEDQWVILRGEKVLWLPSQYRPSSWEVKDNIFALGHASGRVSLVKFS